MRLFRIFISQVKLHFSSRPLVCNCLTYGGLYTLSETGQQTIIHKIGVDENKPYDTGTIARYAVMGTLVLPNIMFHWYRWLDRRFPATSAAVIVKKMVLDQCIMAPPTLATFYVGMSLMEAKEDIFEECRQKLLSTWVTASLFWLPVQAINFLLVPASARVVYVSCCCLVWDNVLCILKRSKIKSETEFGEEGARDSVGNIDSGAERRIRDILSSDRHLLSPQELLKTTDSRVLQLNNL